MVESGIRSREGGADISGAASTCSPLPAASPPGTAARPAWWPGGCSGAGGWRCASAGPLPCRTGGWRRNTVLHSSSLKHGLNSCQLPSYPKCLQNSSRENCWRGRIDQADSVVSISSENLIFIADVLCIIQIFRIAQCWWRYKKFDGERRR